MTSLTNQSDMHLLFQQMGEVLSGIHSLRDMMDIRQAQAEQLHDLVRSDLIILRRDQRDLEEKLDFLMCLAQRDIEGLRTNSGENKVSITALIHSVELLRRPIVELTAFKSRAASLFFAFGILGSSALWLAEPIYRWLVDQNLQRR